MTSRDPNTPVAWATNGYGKISLYWREGLDINFIPNGQTIGLYLAPPQDALDLFLKECEAEAAHIEKNGNNLRIKFGDEHEGRCRELCAMYLREFIAAYRIGKRTTLFDAALSAQEPGEAS